MLKTAGQVLDVWFKTGPEVNADREESAKIQQLAYRPEPGKTGPGKNKGGWQG